MDIIYPLQANYIPKYTDMKKILVDIIRLEINEVQM